MFVTARMFALWSILLLQAAQVSASPGAATLGEVYGWVYRTGKEVQINAHVAACLGVKTPQSLYQRTWVSPDGKVHAFEIGEDRTSPFVLMSVQRGLNAAYLGSFWLSTREGRLLAVCDSPFVNADFARVTDGSLDAAFQSEKAYYLDKYGQRARWDRYVPVERDYP
jgi:hypothetical protein